MPKPALVFGGLSERVELGKVCRTLGKTLFVRFEHLVRDRVTFFRPCAAHRAPVIAGLELGRVFKCTPHLLHVGFVARALEVGLFSAILIFEYSSGRKCAGIAVLHPCTLSRRLRDRRGRSENYRGHTCAWVAVLCLISPTASVCCGADSRGANPEFRGVRWQYGFSESSMRD